MFKEDEAETFYFQLNFLHPSFQFNMEVESDSALSFLDVLVERNEESFITSVYRKITGLYTNWNSFVPKSQKLNLISTLAHGALICFSCRLDREMENIYRIFRDNGYPANIVKRT